MAAGVHNFTIEQGATFDTTLTWRDGNGALVNVTGYTARMQLRSAIGASQVALELLTTNSRIVLGGAAGTIRLVLTATDAAALGQGTYVYDLEMVSSGGVVTRLLKGSVTVDPEVTR